MQVPTSVSAYISKFVCDPIETTIEYLHIFSLKENKSNYIKCLREDRPALPLFIDVIFCCSADLLFPTIGPRSIIRLSGINYSPGLSKSELLFISHDLGKNRFASNLFCGHWCGSVWLSNHSQHQRSRVQISNFEVNYFPSLVLKRLVVPNVRIIITLFVNI